MTASTKNKAWASKALKKLKEPESWEKGSTKDSLEQSKLL